MATVWHRAARPAPSGGARTDSGAAAGPADEVWIERFAKSTRWFHWTFASAFLCLASTGAALALRSALALPPALAQRLIRIHEAAAVCLFAVPALVVFSGDTGAVLRDLRELVRWSRDDLRWLALQPRAVLGRAALPPAGKLNAGQKVNAIAMGGLACGLALSGAVLWSRPGSFAALFAHLALFAAWIPLFAGHLSLALLVPSTRPALRGILFGRVRRSWAEHHHARWVEELDRAEGRPERDAPR